MTERYARTAEAATAVGVSHATLKRWAHEGKVTPAWITPGGQYRWDVNALRHQLGLPQPETPPKVEGAPPHECPEDG